MFPLLNPSHKLLDFSYGSNFPLCVSLSPADLFHLSCYMLAFYSLELSLTHGPGLAEVSAYN